MLMAILMGLLRYAITAAGTALGAHAVSFVEGIPQVHNLTQLVVGGAMVAVGGVASAIGNVKTQSGSIYKTNQ